MSTWAPPPTLVELLRIEASAFSVEFQPEIDRAFSKAQASSHEVRPAIEGLASPFATACRGFTKALLDAAETLEIDIGAPRTAEWILKSLTERFESTAKALDEAFRANLQGASFKDWIRRTFAHYSERATQDAHVQLQRRTLKVAPRTLTAASGSGGPMAQLPSVDPRRVAVVHGRNAPAREAIFTFLRALDLDPVEWEEAVQATGKASPYTGEVVEALFSITRAAVVIFTGDEDVSLRESLREEPASDERGVQSRPNVLFEAGLAFGKYPERTILVQIGPHRHVSDLFGRNMVRFDGSREKRDALRMRLRSAGCVVKDGGTGWLDAGSSELRTALELAGAKSPLATTDPPEIAEAARELGRNDRMIRDAMELVGRWMHRSENETFSYEPYRNSRVGDLITSGRLQSSSAKEQELLEALERYDRAISQFNAKLRIVGRLNPGIFIKVALIHATDARTWPSTSRDALAEPFLSLLDAHERTKALLETLAATRQ